MQILRLTLKKKYFDEIESGEKTNEYREDKQYWRSRLTEDGQFKKFDEIWITNGYGLDKPFMRIKYISTGWEDGNLTPLKIQGQVFDIALGEILERSNIK